MYFHGTEPNPFTCRIFCGECGSPYSRHTWSSQGIHQWQCRDHRVNGLLTCQNAFVRDSDLRAAFVKGYNSLISDSALKDKWQEALKTGSALEKVRARQMIELAEQGILEEFVDELAQLVIREIIIYGSTDYAFTFMDGSSVRIDLSEKAA